MSLAWLVAAVFFVSIDSGTGRGFAGLQPAAQGDLVQTSRKAIIDTGFSAAYFDQHFKLLQLIDKPGDMRVIWRYSVGEYELRITDAVGFYTVAGGRKSYLHSVANNLGATRDIVKTISKRRAASLMQSCIGKFASDSVVLMKLHKDRTAALYLMAYTARGRGKEERERTEKNTSRPADAQDRPPVEEGRDRPLIIGYINLETGKCSRGDATVTP